MTKHVITGSFALVYGAGSNNAGDEWVPNNFSAAQPIWSVLVLQFGQSKIGKDSFSSGSHLGNNLTNGRRIALVANWKGPAPDYTVDPITDGMYFDPALNDGEAQKMLQKIFRGAGSGAISYGNRENAFAVFGGQAPPIIPLAANIAISAGTSLATLTTGDTITIPTVGVITIPPPS